MRIFYLIGAIVVGVIVLVLSFAQYGSTCSWLFAFNPGTRPLFVLLQMTFLGMIVGGLLVLFWKSGEEANGEDEIE